ncbi:MAG: methyl-accepting chemotaxis protein, partial [Candidatus Competibacter denitrificans]
VEQTAAASHSMGDQAHELQRLMGFFKLDRTNPTAGTTATSSAKAPTPLRPVPTTGSRPTVVKTPAKPRPVAAARKPAATAAATEQEWEEF